MAVRSVVIRGRRDQRDPSPEIEPFAPAWSHQAVDWLWEQPQWWSAVAAVLALVLVVVSGVLLFGGGYATIQGVRVPLNAILRLFGRGVETDGLPPLAWWTLPALTNIIQTFARRMPGFRVLWWPTVIIDTATSAVFLALGASLLLASVGGVALNVWLWAWLGPLATLAGFGVTLGAEKLLLGALRILYGIATGR